MVQWIETPAQRRAIARQILEALPEWFGIQESRESYIQGSGDQPFWADLEDGAARGFLALRETSPYTAEVAVMGVLPEYHRLGIGRALFDAARRYARGEGYEFLQVKTVREGCYASYDGTNAFYHSLGFRELECFPTLWDDENPCQIFIMWLG